MGLPFGEAYRLGGAEGLPNLLKVSRRRPLRTLPSLGSRVRKENRIAFALGEMVRSWNWPEPSGMESLRPAARGNTSAGMRCSNWSWKESGRFTERTSL